MLIEVFDPHTAETLAIVKVPPRTTPHGRRMAEAVCERLAQAFNREVLDWTTVEPDKDNVVWRMTDEC
jgi:hypothetical protein